MRIAPCDVRDVLINTGLGPAGDLSVAQACLDISDDRRMSDHETLHQALAQACVLGFIPIARRLLALDGDREIDVSKDDYAAFRAACSSLHLDIVRDLLRLDGHRRVDVNAAGSEALRTASIYDTLDDEQSGINMSQRRARLLPLLLTSGADRLPPKDIFDECCTFLGPFAFWANQLDNRPRAAALLQHRRAHYAHVDAKVLRGCCAQGRPLELQRRLVLGRLAAPPGLVDGLLEVCLEFGHTDCATIL